MNIEPVLDIAALYPRLSTPKQIGNASDKDQMEHLPTLGTALGLPVVRYSDDRGISAAGGSLSGARPKREDMDRLLDDVNAGEVRGAVDITGRVIARARIVVLICVDWSRLSRDMDLIEAMTIKVAMRDAGVKIVTPGKTYDLDNESDDLLVNFEAMIAGAHRLKIAKATTRGRYTRAKEGRFMGYPVPFGYRLVFDVPHADGRPRGRLVIEEAEAAVVRLLFTLYADGLRDDTTGALRLLSQQDVAAELNRRGFTYRERAFSDRSKHPGRGTDGRRPWGQHDVYRLIRNPHYLGSTGLGRGKFGGAGGKPKVSRWARDIGPVETQHDDLRIVDPALWLRAQAVREGRGRVAPRAALPTWPLQGLLRCPHCGAKLVAQTVAATSTEGKSAARRGLPRPGYYVCGAYKLYRREEGLGCPKGGFSIGDRLARAAVEREWIALFEGLDREQLLARDARRLRKAQQRHTRRGGHERLAEIEVQKQRLYDAVQGGAMPVAEAKARRLTLEAEEAAVTAQLKAAEASGAARDQMSELAAIVAGEGVAARLAALGDRDPARYRQLMGQWFCALTVIGEGPSRRRTARVLPERTGLTTAVQDAVAESAGESAFPHPSTDYAFTQSVQTWGNSPGNPPVFQQALTLLAPATG